MQEKLCQSKVGCDSMRLLRGSMLVPKVAVIVLWVVSPSTLSWKDAAGQRKENPKPT